MSPTSPTNFSWGASHDNLFGAKPASGQRRRSSIGHSPVDLKTAFDFNSSPTTAQSPDIRGRIPAPVVEQDSSFRSRSLSITPRRPSVARRESSTSSWRQRTRSVAAAGGTNRRASMYRQGSLGNLALANQDEEIPQNLQTKCNIMVQHLYHQLKERLWISENATDEGVVLKITRDAYTCSPANLAYQSEGFFDAVEGLNVRVALTISTEVISLFLSNQDATSIPLPNGLRLQVLPNMSALPTCQKHQSAAFVADRGCLVLWADDPREILSRASKLINEIVMLIWEDGLDNDELNDNKGEVIVSSVEKDSASSSVDVEQGFVPSVRRRVAWQPLTVGATMALLFLSTGTGYGQIVEEIYFDRSYARLLLILVMPMQLWVSLFFFQSMVCSVLQMVGPISQLKRNTKFYSGEKPTQKPRAPGTQLPHVTIQMPVYKEGLQAVIEPTITSIKAAIATYEMQGGSANIFINDDGMQLLDAESAQARRDYYDEHGIGWVARPKHNPNPAPDQEIFLRRGKFKKASNMNYAMWVSTRVEDKLLAFERHADWDSDLETNLYYEILAEVIDEDEGRTWANGNIRIGDYILIIDSDTRVPLDCFLDSTTEMEESPEVAIIQYVSGVMNVTSSFFEAAISNFTRLVYTQIKFAVSNGDVAPFVGHNAILRWQAIQSIGYNCELDNREKFWSEDTVSEDFDLALRLQAVGWILRLGAYTGDGFQEGVSLTVYDELARWEKYAYGCSELLFHPVREWRQKGVFTKLFKNFVMAKNMPLSAKITIMSYVGTYYAIGSAAFLTLLNYFLIGWLNGWLDHFYMSSFKIYFALYIVFSGCGNLSLAVLRYRSGETPKFFVALWDAFKFLPLMTIFLGGISIHVGQAIISHMAGIDMSWGATSKEADGNVSFLTEMPIIFRQFRWTFILCGIVLTTMIVLGTGMGFIPEMWQISMVIAVWPILSVTLSHLFLPLLLNPGLMRFTF